MKHQSSVGYKLSPQPFLRKNQVKHCNATALLALATHTAPG